MIWQTDSYISYDNFRSYRQFTVFLYKSQLLLFELEPNFKQDILSGFKNCRSFNMGTSHRRTKSYYISEHHANNLCTYPGPWQIQDTLHPLRTKLIQIALCLLKAKWAWTIIMNELTCSKFLFHCNCLFFSEALIGVREIISAFTSLSVTIKIPFYSKSSMYLLTDDSTVISECFIWLSKRHSFLS